MFNHLCRVITAAANSSSTLVISTSKAARRLSGKSCMVQSIFRMIHTEVR